MRESSVRALGLERQVLIGTAPFEGAGLWVAAVPHVGNQNSSSEEVDLIDKIVTGPAWAGSAMDRLPRRVSSNDIRRHSDRRSLQLTGLAAFCERNTQRGIRVGTVDRFQGQEAPVVIYSMATSTPEDAPRGMEFLTISIG